MGRSFYQRPPVFFGVVLFGFIALSFIVAVGPAIDVQSRYRPLPDSKPMTSLERRGFKVYVAEGCPACHTQQVRPLEMDRVWGRPTVAADYARLEPLAWWMQTPAVLGSERTGPDLTNIGTRQPSEAWQLMHLYDPRSVTTWSIMPRYRYLFEVVAAPSPNATVVPVPPGFGPSTGKVVATDRALALVAYLLSLKQAPLPPGVGGDPAPAASAGGGSTSDEGAALFANNCASCHQPDGVGVPSTFPPLVGNAVVADEDPTMHISTVLFGATGRTIGGVKYAVAMLPFADILSDAEVAAIVNYERSKWGNGATLVTEELVAKVRAQGAPP